MGPYSYSKMHHHNISSSPILYSWKSEVFMTSWLFWLFDIKEGLVEQLTGSPLGKNSKGLMISQIQAWTPQIVVKIIAMGLTPTGRGSDLKLDMLEAVDTITNTGKIYRWAEYVTDMLKGICEKCQELGGIIRFPSLIIWIVMYYLCPVRDKQFQEPTRFHM